MTLREEVVQLISEVPDNKLNTLMQFARILKETKNNDSKSENNYDDEIKAVRHGGWVKKIWMSDDFNDPMDFVSQH